jgi:hypothetical protein
MTIKELYEKAVAEGYEDAEIGVDVTVNHKDGYRPDDLYDELLTEDQIEFGGYYEGVKRVKNCIWIYIEAEGRA